MFATFQVPHMHTVIPSCGIQRVPLIPLAAACYNTRIDLRVGEHAVLWNSQRPDQPGSLPNDVCPFV